MILEVFSYLKDFMILLSVYLCCIPDFLLSCMSTSMAVVRKIALLGWEPDIFWYSVCTNFWGEFPLGRRTNSRRGLALIPVRWDGDLLSVPGIFLPCCMERSGTADTRNGAPPAANPRDIVFDSLWPHFCFDCVVPHLYSFFSSPYIPLCPLPLVFSLCIPCQPCTCHCAITLFLLSGGEDVPEMLALVLVFILLSAMSAEGCIRIWKDFQRNGWRLWQLQSFLWDVLWRSWNMQLAEACGVRCTKWVPYLLNDTQWWKAEWTQLLHCKGRSSFLCACHCMPILPRTGIPVQVLLVQRDRWLLWVPSFSSHVFWLLTTMNEI